MRERIKDALHQALKAQDQRRISTLRLILAAIKDAQRKAQDRMQAEMARISQDMGLPADMKLPF